ncbi:CIC11C00000000455 [Sungouiella intermedia]|uniref:Uridine kinase n=1 Tax=Sungouiella intermedia TaxID=45354 RepID=A0A1L0D7K8_9ASCO|nr:CIC11C00000000455 [[Candida] intermedia]
MSPLSHKPRRSSRIAPNDDESGSFFSPTPKSEPHTSVSDLDLYNLSIKTSGQKKVTYIPPWTEPYVIGVAGFSGSGKTSISQRIILELNQPWTVLLSFDNFYNPLTPEQSKQAFANNFDFDTPDAMDIDMVVEKLTSLKQGKKTEIPVYSFAQHTRTDKTITIYGANVIIIEGIYALYDKRLLDLMDVKIFVDTDLDVCLARRLTRDILYRGRDLEGALRQWETFVKPNAVASVTPTMQNADLVIPRGLENTTAIELMIKHIQKQLALKSSLHLRRLKSLGLGSKFPLLAFSNLKVLPTTNHTAGIHSILFSQSTDRTDFIFYFDRIANLLLELALEQLTVFAPKIVKCHGNYEFKGVEQTQDIVAVSIIRSGDCFMTSIRKTFPAIPIGKLLIQSDSLTGEPQLHAESLPSTINGAQYFLFDAQIISGAGAIMAIQVLVDHGINLKDVTLITYLLTEIGVRRVFHVFPEVKIIVGKLSNVEESESKYNSEKFHDTDWLFRTRFIDSLYFGTD